MRIEDDFQLEAFLSAYGDPDEQQDAAEALVDPQLKSLTLTLATTIGSHSAGTILDIGSGTGVLLTRLCNLAVFRRRENWVYAASDLKDKLPQIVDLAYQNGVHRRVETLDLEELTADEPRIAMLPRPFIAVVRNVLHELNIYDTGILFYTLQTLLQPNDSLIVQDLQVFPRAERGNVCWDPEQLERLLSECGFDGNVVIETSRSGNRWFTIHAQRTEGARTLDDTEVHQCVIASRKRQYDLWQKAGTLSPGDEEVRNRRIAFIDFDLQRAALQDQLLKEGTMGVSARSMEDDARVASEAFSRQLESFALKRFLASALTISRPTHFRDRGGSQDALEKFLWGKQQIAVIVGASYIGKSVLVSEVLARRSHSRQPLFIDAQHTSSVWNLIEQYLSGAGCHVSYDILASSPTLQFASVRSVVGDFAHRLAEHCVVVFDHIERLLDDDGHFEDSEIHDFLALIAAEPHAKVILTSRRSLSPGALPSDLRMCAEQPFVGRLRDDFIEHILDDLLDRAALGVESYPESLVTAIDGHPFLAVVAAQVIRNEGAPSLGDESFLVLLRHQMRRELMQRVVTEQTRPALNLLTTIRVPIPRKMFEHLAGRESVRSAMENGLLYAIRDRSNAELITGIALFRGKMRDDDELEELKRELLAESYGDYSIHREIAEWFGRLYRDSGDPIWVREMHYHTLAAGNPSLLKTFGTAYRDELFAAGQAWFRRHKKFAEALEAFEAAKNLGLKSTILDLRIASCYMRLGRTAEGEKEYARLMEVFPAQGGIKTSFVDSLLYRREWQRALDALKEFEFAPRDRDWIAFQFGKAYLELGELEEAIAAFRVRQELNPDRVAHFMLARAYEAAGMNEEREKVLIQGIRRFPGDRDIVLQYCRYLVAQPKIEKAEFAEELIGRLRSRFPEDSGVIREYVRLLCRTGRVEQASVIMETDEWTCLDREERIPIVIEVMIARGRFQQAAAIVDANEEALGEAAGMYRKRVYVEWAIHESGEDRIVVAKKGLEYCGSTAAGPYRLMEWVLEARLARVAKEFERLKCIAEKISDVNREIAELVTRLVDPLEFVVSFDDMLSCRYERQ